ncbi:MAG: hypothetical protein IPG71_00735 [bacterium]|nr:hypothetical protein [bacterium]
MSDGCTACSRIREWNATIRLRMNNLLVINPLSSPQARQYSQLQSKGWERLNEGRKEYEALPQTVEGSRIVDRRKRNSSPQRRVNRRRIEGRA